MKRPLLIAKHDVAVPEYYQHSGMMIMPTIHELECHWHEIGIVPIQLRPEIHPSMGRITPWKLHDFDVATQIKRDEVARGPRRFMAHEGIDLD